MKVKKEEFNKYFDIYKLKYDIEVKIKLPYSEFKKWLINNADPVMKYNFETKFIKPKQAISLEVIEELTGLSKEKIIYIKKNFEEFILKNNI